jgi:hypothetical protein
MSSNLAATTPQQTWPKPNGEPSTWVWLDDLPLPPEVEAKVDEYCRRMRFRRARHRHSVQEDVKLEYYFPGMDVALQHTERGILVLMVGDSFSEPFSSWLQSLPRPERCKILIWPVSDPTDETTRI